MESKGGVGFLDQRQKLCRDRMVKQVFLFQSKLGWDEVTRVLMRLFQEEAEEAVDSNECCDELLDSGSGCCYPS